MSHRRGAVILLYVLALLVAGAPPSRAEESVRTVDGEIDDWTGASSMVGGETTVSRGEVIYQDYIYDDAGSDGGPENHRDYRASAEPTGDYQYPNESERCRFNCADLLEFRAALEGDRVHILIRLNTLLATDSTVAAIAFGPRGQDRESHQWPFDANLSTPGSKHVLTLWGTEGAFDEADLASVGGEVAIGTDDNVIEASLPAELVGERFRAYAATGLWDKDNKQWMAIQSAADEDSPGGGTPSGPRAFNVAFRPGEIGFYYEEGQATALGEGDISPFHADIDLRAPDTPRRPPPRGVWQERIVESSATVPPGEGVLPDYPTTGQGETEAVRGRGFYSVALGVPVPTRFHYLGRHQPYSLYVPKKYERATLANHPGGYPHGLNTLSPHYAWLAEDAKAVMVTPLARGPYSFCTDYAHLDVLEAWGDALSLFPNGSLDGRKAPKGDFVDTDRNMLWGYSMGGLCTARLAVLHPDMFASAVQWAASSGLEEDHEPVDSAAGHPGNGYPVDLMENTRRMTWRVNHCAADDVAYYPGVLPHVERLEALGYVYNFRTMYGCEHLAQEVPGTPAYVRYEEDAEETETAHVEPDPAHVTYKTAEAWWRPDISEELVFDRAYWASRLRVRDKSAGLKAYGKIDAVTRGLGAEDLRTERTGPTAGTMAIFPYTDVGRAPAEGEPIKKANEFDATLSNLRTIAFDLDRMGLTINRPLTATLVTDGKVEIALAGAAGAQLADCKPAPCPGARADGRDLVLAMPEPGEFVVTVARGRGERGSGESGGQRGSDEGAQAQARGREDGGAAGEGVRVLGSAGAASGSALAATGADIAALGLLGLVLAFTGMTMTRLRHEGAKGANRHE